MTATTPSTEWWFYHVKDDGVDRAVYGVVKLCLAKDWRVLIVSPVEKRRENLDRLLWTAEPTSFIPHGRAEAEGLDAAEQPVLISAAAYNANSANVLMLLDTAEAALDAEYDRCISLFGDFDDSAKSHARARYKSAKDAELIVKYFQQDTNGKWVERH